MIDRRLLVSAAALLAASTAPAFAQSAPPTPADTAQLDADFNKDSITVGVGGAYVPDYDGSNDSRLVPAPAVIGSVKGFNFSVIGNRANIDLIPSRPGQTIDFQFGPVGVINFNRSSTSSIDDPRVKALGKLGTSLELGGYIGIGKTGIITSKYDKLSVSVSYRKGVTGANGSGIVQPSINYLTPLSTKAAVGLFGSAERVEAGYAQTYFSITPGQSIASGLPVYNARGGWKDYSIGGFATYSLTGNLLHGFKVIAGGTYTRELNGFSYSPIVRIAGSPNQWIGAAGIAYTF